MQDVPNIDYKEQIRDLLYKAAKEALPPKVRALFESPGLQDFIKHGHLSQRWGGNLQKVYMSISLPSTTSNGFQGVKIPAEVTEKAHALGLACYQQEAKRKDLEIKLNQAAASVSTRKALAALLPEFEKYLPPEESQTKVMLPAVANVVSDFVKAGWPKQKQNNTSKTKTTA